MSLNISLELEQQQRLQNDLAAVEAQIDKDTDLYYQGQFDGATGGKPEPELWSNLNYRSGWLLGVGEFWDKKYQTVFNDEPF